MGSYHTGQRRPGEQRSYSFVEDLSPVAVIAKVDASKAADNATGTAPKTGVEANNSWMACGMRSQQLLWQQLVPRRSEKEKSVR